MLAVEAARKQGETIMSKSSKKPKTIPTRVTVYSENGKPALRVLPSAFGERLSRYLFINLLSLSILVMGFASFLGFEKTSLLKVFVLCFGPGIFTFFLATWLCYRSFSKANSKIIKFICDGKKLIVVQGKKEEICLSDKIRFERHMDNKFGIGAFDYYQIKVFLRRPPKRRKKFFRLVPLPDNDIRNIKNFCSKNKLHYKEVVLVF